MVYSIKNKRTKKEKYESCVMQVKKKDKTVNPYAVCSASVEDKKKQEDFKVDNPKKKEKLKEFGKVKLTKEEQDNIMARLPVEQAVIVPSTKGIKNQKPISKKEFDKRIDDTRKFFYQKYGGFTSVKTTGGYVSKDGRVIKEKGAKVTSFSSKADYNKDPKATFKQSSKWAKEWKQESISYENEGDMYLIT